MNLCVFTEKKLLIENVRRPIRQFDNLFTLLHHHIHINDHIRRAQPFHVLFKFSVFFDHVAIAFCLHITRPVLFGLQATVMSMHQVSIAHEIAQAASYNVKKAGGRSQASLKLPTATDMTKSHIYDTKIPYLLLSEIALLSSNLQ